MLRCTAMQQRCVGQLSVARASPFGAGRGQVPLARRGGNRVCATPSNGSGPGGEESKEEKLLRQRGQDQLIIVSGAVTLTVTAFAGYYFFSDAISDWLLDSTLGGGEFGPGDCVGALLWTASFWFTSPLQLLLLFFGDYDVERPSDRLIRGVGSIAGQPMDEMEYVAPVWIKGIAALGCLAFGTTVALALSQGLGDATWSVSTGIGACMGSAVYEAGRPTRLNTEEAQLLEGQWKDFARFADARLQRNGRCHESEVFAAFRLQYVKYRGADTISDAVLRDMVRNWHPDVRVTSTGFLKNLSVMERVDPFTLAVTGTARNTAPLAAGAAPEAGAAQKQQGQ
ncbi:hypothetical protein FOA52_005457 [Chlamydomonas sp. UWO 241]|nr:hypothetical protein FOA52_005457 [Chlamydomonas sp. UWO 241]